MLPNAIASLSFRCDGAIEHTSVSGQKIKAASLPYEDEPTNRSEYLPVSAHPWKENQVTLTRGSTALDLQGPGELASIISSSTSMQDRANVQIGGDGALVSDSMLMGHIPRLKQRDQTSVSLVPHKDNDECMRMVWNKNSQESYSVFDYQSEHLPSIIYRNKRTIERVDKHAVEVKKRRLLHPAAQPSN